MVELGGNIHLEGFDEVDKGAMVIVKKIVGNYGRKFTDNLGNFEKLSVQVSEIEKSESPGGYSIGAVLCRDGNKVSKIFQDRNLFIALDQALKEIEKHS